MGTAARQMAHTDVVQFSVDNGKVVATPYYAQFYVGQDIVFQAGPGIAWAIEFHDKRSPGGPGGPLVIHGNGPMMVPRLVGRRTGHFGYSVALAGPGPRELKEEDTIYLDVACPEIIIDAASG